MPPLRQKLQLSVFVMMALPSVQVKVEGENTAARLGYTLAELPLLLLTASEVHTAPPVYVTMELLSVKDRVSGTRTVPRPEIL